MKKLSKEILQERSNIIHNNQYEIIGEYVNSSTKILIKHLSCNNEFYQKPSNHLLGKGCVSCSGKEKGSREKLQKLSNIKHNNSYEIIGEYANNLTPIKIKHLTCNTIFETLSNSHLRKHGCCPTCFRNDTKTKEIFQQESNIIHNNEYEIIGNYINSDTKIKIKHLVCGSTFYQKPHKHLFNNKCPSCNGNNPLTKESLQLKSDIKHNYQYTIIGNYINYSTPVLIRHNICGTEYLQSPNNHLSNRTCYFCRNGQSNGEKIIDNYLRNKNIIFQYNRALLDCKYNGYSLRFDFYIPIMNICIEFDGEQHFKPIEKFGGLEYFNEITERDNFKNKWCIENNIKLYRISYLDKNMIDILDSIFNI